MGTWAYEADYFIFFASAAALAGIEALLIGHEGRGPGRNHSCSFDQRRRPDTLRTEMAIAFFCPTNTTSRFPRVTPV